MSLNRIAENKIREAIQAGEFDNLPGKGQPIDLDDYFSTPEDLRLVYSVLKNANCRPEEVELLREIAALDERAARARGDVECADLEKRRRDLRLRLDLLMEQRRRHRR